jgi:hypothetical protein
MRRNLLIALLAAAVFTLAGWTLAAPQSASPQWEYMQTCTMKDLKKLDAETAQLNQAGAQGWELASATMFGTVSCYYFKRPKQ